MSWRIIYIANQGKEEKNGFSVFLGKFERLKGIWLSDKMRALSENERLFHLAEARGKKEREMVHFLYHYNSNSEVVV